MKTELLIAAAAAGTLAFLGACTGTQQAPGDPPPVGSAQAPDSAFAAALAASREAGSARVTGSISTTTPQATGTATIAGVQDFSSGAMDLTVSSDLFGAGEQVRQLMVEGRAYVQLPELPSSWVEIDPTQFAGLANPLLAGRDIGDDLDLRADPEASAEGPAVDYYSSDIDLGQALALAGVPGATIAAVLGGLPHDAGTATVRIAIDGRDRLVGWTLDAAVELADGSTLASTADVRWSDFGVAAEIAPPAESDLVDEEALAALLPRTE